MHVVRVYYLNKDIETCELRSFFVWLSLLLRMLLFLYSVTPVSINSHIHFSKSIEYSDTKCTTNLCFLDIPFIKCINIFACGWDLIITIIKNVLLNLQNLKSSNIDIKNRKTWEVYFVTDTVVDWLNILLQEWVMSNE